MRVLGLLVLSLVVASCCNRTFIVAHDGCHIKTALSAKALKGALRLRETDFLRNGHGRTLDCARFAGCAHDFAGEDIQGTTPWYVAWSYDLRRSIEPNIAVYGIWVRVHSTGEMIIAAEYDVFVNPKCEIRMLLRAEGQVEALLEAVSDDAKAIMLRNAGDSA